MRHVRLYTVRAESFLVSLSLALVCSLSRHSLSVDTLFIDEGFGTLSSDYLNTVMDTLEKLHQMGGKKVGIISHVEGLRERIKTQIQVKRIDNSRSEIANSEDTMNFIMYFFVATINRKKTMKKFIKGVRVCSKNYSDEVEVKIQHYKKEGYKLPSRHLLRTEEQLAGIRESAKINTAIAGLHFCKHPRRNVHCGN